jgi:hypothetical protein
MAIKEGSTWADNKKRLNYLICILKIVTGDQPVSILGKELCIF